MHKNYLGACSLFLRVVQWTALLRKSSSSLSLPHPSLHEHRPSVSVSRDNQPDKTSPASSLEGDQSGYSTKWAQSDHQEEVAASRRDTKVFGATSKPCLNNATLCSNDDHTKSRNLVNNSNNRRYSDTLSISQSKYRPQYKNEPHNQDKEADILENSPLKSVDWNKISPSRMIMNHYHSNLDSSVCVSSDSQKAVSNRQDISALFGTYSSLTNMGMKFKQGFGGDKHHSPITKNYMNHRMHSSDFKTSPLQCVPAAYATISSSAFRELTQKVK